MTLNKNHACPQNYLLYMFSRLIPFSAKKDFSQISKTLKNNSKLFHYGSYLGTVFVTYTFHSIFITSCSTFRLIKAFIKKVFLSMSHSLHTAYAHHFESFCYEQRCHDVGFPASQKKGAVWLFGVFWRGKTLSYS